MDYPHNPFFSQNFLGMSQNISGKYLDTKRNIKKTHDCVIILKQLKQASKVLMEKHLKFH